jgi:putative ABC transport system substrate-binding protein
MDRRRFLLTSLAGALAVPLAAEAQRAATVARVALLRPAPPSPELARIFEAFKQGLRGYGYVEGQDVAVDFRYPTNNTDRLSDLATDLVEGKPDVIFAAASSGVEAVRKVTATIPIVALDLETDPRHLWASSFKSSRPTAPATSRTSSEPPRVRTPGRSL